MAKKVMEDRFNNLSKAMRHSPMWNYDEDAGKIYTLLANKYLSINSGFLCEDTDISKIGVLDEGSEIFLLNNNRINLHACNA